MMFFSNKGKMYRTVVDNIPDGTNTTKGVPINSLIQLESDEKIIAVTSLHRKTTPEFVIFITKQGMLKKSFLSEYTGAKRNAGIAALKVKDGDSVASILFQDKEDIIILTKNGMSIKFPTKDIGVVGRVALGVKGIKLAEDDEVISALSVHKETDEVAVFSSTGMGKKIPLADFPTQAKGGKGTSVYKISPQNGELVGAAMVSNEDNILICGNKSNICISASEIPSLGRVAIGNIMIKDNKVISITKF
jgi:DNA gyrase subunit A